MDYQTIMLVVFTITLYLFLFLTKRELVYSSLRRTKIELFFPLFLGIVFASMFFYSQNVEDKIRGTASMLIIISYAFNNRGLTDTRIMSHNFDNKGISFEEIVRVLFYYNPIKKQVGIVFFRGSQRLPMMRFNKSKEEMMSFLDTHLNKGTPIDVIVNPKHT